MTSFPPALALAALALQAPAAPFSSEAGGFRVAMPAAPKEQTKKVETPAGPIDVHLFVADRGDVAYFAAYSDFPVAVAVVDPDKRLEDGIRSAVADMKGKLLVKSAVKLDGYPGREFTAEVPIAGAGKGLFRSRIYAVNARLYQAYLVGARAKVEGGDADAYLDSLALTRTPPATVIQPVAPGKAFASEAGRFRVKFPATPRALVQPVPTPAGPIDMHILLSERDGAAFFAAYADYELDPAAIDADELLEGAVAGSLQPGDRTLLSKRDIGLDAHPGKAYRFRLAFPGGQRGVGSARVYLAGRRLYQVVVIAAEDKDDPKADEAFLRSFVIVKPPTP